MCQELEDLTGLKEQQEKLLEIVDQPLQHKVTNEPVYCLGMIDILEKFDCDWRTQGCALGCLTRMIPASCNATWSNPEGITAIPPLEYAFRFDEFMQEKVLGVKYTNEKWRPRQRWGNPWK